MGAKEQRRRNLKRRLFARDGWQDASGSWCVECAFGCGDTLVWSTATIDRYPIMGQHGGTYTYDNTRLACVECNSRNRNKNDPKFKTRRQKRKEKITTKAELKARKKAARAVSRQLELSRLSYQISSAAEGSSRNGEIRMDF